MPAVARALKAGEKPTVASAKMSSCPTTAPLASAIGRRTTATSEAVVGTGVDGVEPAWRAAAVITTLVGTWRRFLKPFFGDGDRYDPKGLTRQDSHRRSHADRGEGAQRPGDGRASRPGPAALREGFAPGQPAGRPRGGVPRGAEPGQPDLQHRRGDALPQGHDTAREGALARPAARPQARLGGPLAPGQATDGQAPRAAHRRRRGRPGDRRRGAGAAGRGRLLGHRTDGVRGPAAGPAHSTTLGFMPRILDKALRLGEGRQFKQYAKRVEAINRFEPELELLDDDELKQRFAEVRERVDGGESLDDVLPEVFPITREAGRRT